MKKIKYKLNIGLVALLLAVLITSCNDVDYNGIVLDKPIAEFSIPDSSDIGVNGTIYTINSSANGTDYFWYINDSLVSEGIEPVLSFNKLGPNTLKLVAQNGIDGNFLTHEFKQDFDVTASAFAYFTTESIVKRGDLLSLINKSARATKYLWEFGDDDETTSVEETPSFAYAEAGEYTISLTVENEDGKKSTWTHNITVIAPIYEEYFDEEYLTLEEFGWSAFDGGTIGETWVVHDIWSGYHDCAYIYGLSDANWNGVDDWLVSPKLTYNGKASLSLKIHQTRIRPIKIWIAKKVPGSPDDFTIKVEEVVLESTGEWVDYTFSLKEHVSDGEEFYIGFHIDETGAITRIDNVVVV